MTSTVTSRDEDIGDVTSARSAESREERPSSGVMTSSSNDVISMSVLKSATGLVGTQLPVFQCVFRPDREMYFLGGRNEIYPVFSFQIEYSVAPKASLDMQII